MGFFSDLKQDLSQAMSELKPETAKEAVEEEVVEAEPQVVKESIEEVVSYEKPEKKESDDNLGIDFLDLGIDSMLDKVEASSVKEPEYEESNSYAGPGISNDTNSYIEPEAYEPVKTYVEPEAYEPIKSYIEPVSYESKSNVKESTLDNSYNSASNNAYRAPAPQRSMEIPVVSRTIPNDEVSTIMDSMIINGNMATEGSLEIRGSIVGNVEALGKLNITGSIQGDSSAAEIFADGANITGDVKSLGAIKIGQSTTIIGNVFATSAVIAGAIKGDIDVKGPVILDSTAIVLGNIKSKAVQINNGAVIEGMCSQCYAEVNPMSFFEELKKMR